MRLITSTFTFSDSAVIPYYEIESQERDKTKTVIVGIHGLMSDLDYWKRLADNLTVLASVDVHLPILRGYTNAETKKGDIPNAGQYDNDLVEILQELEHEYERIVLIGHSTGAANVCRILNAGRLPVKTEKIILAAPFLHPALPVNREISNQENGSDSWAVYSKRAKFYHIWANINPFFQGRAPVVKVPVRDVPYDASSQVYPYELSYRLVMSRFIDLKHTNWQLFAKSSVFIGSADEVIDSEKLKQLWKDKTGTDMHTVDSEDHNSLLTSPPFMQHILESVRLL
ncbi:serine aminopeptidase S33 family [Salisediminibacterium halotolerans]|nr:serine aminopeptidase S33 family [Actinophytocola xinjiangensis]RPE87890.1 serine aminopeptidase S33 family [Salisediminibacterium halotolerans]TWG37913.1 serine aminopeptidase S33 family [Salisediminibacterium halotolerans]